MLNVYFLCVLVSRIDLLQVHVPVVIIRGGGRGGSIGRASASRSDRLYDQSSNPVRSTRKICDSFSGSKCCADSSAVCPTPVCTRTA